MYQLLKEEKSIFGPPYYNPSNIIKDITNFVIVQMIRIHFEMLQIFYDSDTLRYRIDTKKSQILYEMLQIHYKKCYRFGQSQTHCHTDQIRKCYSFITKCYSFMTKFSDPCKKKCRVMIKMNLFSTYLQQDRCVTDQFNTIILNVK